MGQMYDGVWIPDLRKCLATISGTNYTVVVYVLVKYEWALINHWPENLIIAVKKR